MNNRSPEDDPMFSSDYCMVKEMPTRRPFYQKPLFLIAALIVCAVIVIIASQGSKDSVAAIDRRCESQHSLPENVQSCKLNGYIQLKESM